LSEKEAFRKLYESNLYAQLEQESLKLWHFSPQTLYSMLQEETTTGKFTFPDV